MKKRYDMDLTEVGRRLRAVRSELGLTIDRMCDISGYSKSLISAAENGLKKPAAIYLFTLFDRFNVNINYVFSGKGTMFLSKGYGDDGSSKISDFIQSDDNVKEMFFLMQHIDMVRFAMLSNFIQYKTQNRQVLDQLIAELPNDFDK